MSFIQNLNFFSPKPKSSSTEQARNGEGETPRGQKRKADPEDDDLEDAGNGSQTPSTSFKDRLNAAKSTNKRRSRSISQADDGASSAAAKPEEAPQTDKPAAAPTANVDGVPHSGTQDKSVSSEAPSKADQPASKTPAEETASPTKQAVGAFEAAVDSVKSAFSRTVSRASAVALPATADDDLHEVDTLLSHRVLPDGRVEVQVKWAGEALEDATFEPEEEIQNGAAETLYEYWAKLGGRDKALFEGADAASAPAYHVYSVLKHEKKPRGGFQFLVQWVGYPATAPNTTLETEAKLKTVANDKLEEYWQSKGGRDQFVAKRGRAKKAAQ